MCQGLQHNNGVECLLEGFDGALHRTGEARSGHKPTENSTHMHQGHLKLVNGIKPNCHYILNCSRLVEDVQERSTYCPVSLLDFRVVLELNPQ